MNRFFLHSIAPRHECRRRRIGIAILSFVWLAYAQLVCSSLMAKEPPAATAPATRSPAPAEPRNDLPGLKNFAQVSAALSRGALPSVKGFATLKTRGVKTIVNLCWEHSDRQALAGTRLQYVEIPCNPWNIKEEQVVEFLKIVGDPKNQPLFVHCAFGSDRTGMMVAAYRMLEQKRSADDAVKELYRFGYTPAIPRILADLKGFDSAAIRGKVDAAPRPKVEIIQ